MGALQMMFVGHPFYITIPTLFHSSPHNRNNNCFCKYNDYYCSANDYYRSADNTYCFAPKISNIVSKKSGDSPML